MADITSRIRRLSQVVAEATVAVLGTGKVAGAEIIAAAGVVTVPAGSRIAFGQTGTRPPQAIELTEDVDVPAVNNDELYVRQLPGGASFEIAAAASTPGGALKLADLSGTPVDTVVDTSPAEIGAVSANEVAILDAAANYAAETVEAALAEIGGTPPVDSVFGRTGAVAAASGDYDGAEVDYAPALLADWDGSADPGQVDDALDQLAARVTVEEAEIPPPTAPVDSVFSRIGDVVAASGDYTASEVTNVPAGGIAAITVQAAIDELDSEKARSDDLASVVNAKGASLIGVEDSGANYAGADVEAVLAEIAPQLGVGTDADAIHDNVAAEISVVAEKVTPVAADVLLIEDSAAANAKKRVQIGNLPSGGGALDLLYVRDEKTSGVDAGTFTSGAFQTRVLNTVVVNQITGASLASNQVTLANGTYRIRARAPAAKCNRHRMKLRNITDGADELLGGSGHFPAGLNASNAELQGRFTVSGGPKVFELQHRCQTTVSTDGFGQSAAFGEIEVYAEVWIEKE